MRLSGFQQRPLARPRHTMCLAFPFPLSVVMCDSTFGFDLSVSCSVSSSSLLIYLLAAVSDFLSFFFPLSYHSPRSACISFLFSAFSSLVLLATLRTVVLFTRRLLPRALLSPVPLSPFSLISLAFALVSHFVCFLRSLLSHSLR